MKLAVKILKKLFKAVLILLLVVIGVPVIVIVINMTANSIALSVFSWQLDKTLPPSSVVLEKQTLCGRMQGTGDGMEFLAVALVESPLSLEELTEYYESVRFEYTFPGLRTQEERDFGYKVDVIVTEAVSDIYASENCEETRELYLFFNLDVQDEDNLYYVDIYDEAYWAWFDIRGT